jgi:AraC-like DNA-binding protein
MDSPADNLLLAAQRVLGLDLTVHLREPLMQSGLIADWRRHKTARCLGVKRRHIRECTAFDGLAVHQALRREPRGRVHTCPFGMTEIAVPLIWRDRHCGVLFAGQRWRGAGPPPYPDLPRAESESWLRDRLPLLRGVAHELCALLHQDDSGEPDRRQRILAFIHDRLATDVGVDDLARRLSLSPSRTRHLVSVLFGQPFSQLLREARLGEASRLLTITEWPIGRIATAVGIADQNYFSRLFSQAFGCSPRAYRRGLDQLER